MAGLERSEITRWQAAYPRGRKPRNELGRASAGHRRSYRPLRPCCRTRKRDCRHRLRSGRPHPSPDRLGKASGPGGGCKARDCGTLEIKELSALHEHAAHEGGSNASSRTKLTFWGKSARAFSEGICTKQGIFPRSGTWHWIDFQLSPVLRYNIDT